MKGFGAALNGCWKALGAPVGIEPIGDCPKPVTGRLALRKFEPWPGAEVGKPMPAPVWFADKFAYGLPEPSVGVENGDGEKA